MSLRLCLRRPISVGFLGRTFWRPATGEAPPPVEPFVRKVTPTEDHVFHKKVKLSLLGYDSLVLEQFMKQVKEASMFYGLRSSSELALPKRQETHHIMSLDSSRTISYTIDIYTRFLFLRKVPCHRLDLLTESIQSRLPAGVSLEMNLEAMTDIPSHLVSEDVAADAKRLAKKKKRPINIPNVWFFRTVVLMAVALVCLNVQEAWVEYVGFIT